MHKDLLIFYYNGLKYLNCQFPFKLYDENAVDIGFLWRDSLSGIEHISHQGLDLEMNSILYNLAVCLHNMSYNLPISKESLKTISVNFQQAAWIFQEIRNNVEKIDPKSRGVDFRPDNLDRLVLIELAHSQYCFFKKAELTECSTELLAKVARQTWSYFYNANIMVKGTLRVELEKYCNYPLKTIKSYSEIYDGISMMYTAKYLYQKIESGEANFADVIGYCTEASRILSGVDFDNEAIMEGVKVRLEENEVLRKELQKRNDFLHHENPTKIELLPIIECKNYALLRSLEEDLNKEFQGAWISPKQIREDNSENNDHKYDPSSFHPDDRTSSETSPNSHHYEESKSDHYSSVAPDHIQSVNTEQSAQHAQLAQPGQAVNLAAYGQTSHNFHYNYHAQQVPPQVPSQVPLQAPQQFPQPPPVQYAHYPQQPLQPSQVPPTGADGYYGVTQIMNQPQTTYANCPTTEYTHQPCGNNESNSDTSIGRTSEYYKNITK